MENHDQHIVLITGPSGAGRTTAINALEDIGYETISNLPLSLLPPLLDAPPIGRPLALGIDVRNRDYSTDALIALIDGLATRKGIRAELLFLDCRRNVLSRRFSETRRRHPLAPDTDPEFGIGRELELLGPIRARADILIDTSETSPHELRAEIRRTFLVSTGDSLALSLQSFSYKRGIPHGVDLVFDCRFLKNPYWDENLRALDGRDAEVRAHVASDPRFATFAAKVGDLVQFMLPASRDEGKAHLTIAFGCTGGQHRSVVLAEHLAKHLAEAGAAVSIRHRELERHLNPRPVSKDFGVTS